MIIFLNVTLLIMATLFFLIGRKYLKKVKDGEINNEEYYKKGSFYIIIFSILTMIFIILSGISFFMI